MNNGFYAELTPEEKLVRGIDEAKTKAIEKNLPAGKVICSGAIFCTAIDCDHKELHSPLETCPRVCGRAPAAKCIECCPGDKEKPCTNS